MRPTPEALRALDAESRWELDALPIAADQSPSPTARSVVKLLVADDVVLDAALDSAPPSEPADIAAWLEQWLHAVVERHRIQSGAAIPLPERLLVRHDRIAEVLDVALAPRTRVASAWSLPALDRIASAMRTASALTPSVERVGRRAGLVLLADPFTWSAWAIEETAQRDLLAAAAEFHAAAPWSLFRYDEAIAVEPLSGADATWTACVMGADADQRGLVLYEREVDFARAMSSDEPADDFLGLEGAVISLFFDARAALPRPMQQEFVQHAWGPVVDDAYPSLSVANTPAGGISRAQVDMLTRVLRALSSVALDREAIGHWRSPDINPDAGDIVWQDERTGLQLTCTGSRAPETVVLWDAPSALARGWATGASVNPDALFPRDGRSDAALEQQFAQELPRLDRFNAWLGTPRGERTRARAQATHAHHVELALLFTEHLAFGHGVTLPAIHEVHLRQFLFAWVPEQMASAARELSALLLALQQYFTFLESEELRCAWADAILDERSIIENRIHTAQSSGEAGRAPMWWHDQLNADLQRRVMLPEPLLLDDAPDDGENDEPIAEIGAREAQLMDELQLAHLGWREAAIADGVTAPDAVRALCLEQQRVWEVAPHALFGKSPTNVIRQERRRGARGQ